MPRKKDDNGVLATIERLTGRQPCPENLRNALNKYLRHEELFRRTVKPPALGASGKPGLLHSPDTDNLVRNLLDLDALFTGDTQTVIGIVSGTIDARTVNSKLDSIEHVMRERLAIYGNWVDRIPSAKQVLTTPGIDLRIDRFDERLAVSPRTTDAAIPAFALNALRLHEASEAKARHGLPSPAEYAERADAWLALGDLASADKNACAAIDADPACARAWFIRVAVVLRRMRAATRSSRRARMEAQEIAEPMSAHERSAHEQADEAESEASTQRQSLDTILPQAILHWPQRAGRRDHPDMWRQVRDIFVQRMFAVGTRDGRLACTLPQLAQLNGQGPEWELGRNKHLFANGWSGAQATPFNADETRAITYLLAEYDERPQDFFEIFEQDRIAIDFRLIHLRHILRLENGDAHWRRLRTAIHDSPLDWQAEQLMRDPAIATLWQVHYCRHEGSAAMLAWYEVWLRKSRKRDAERRVHALLRQHAYLYHHEFARQHFAACAVIAHTSLALFEGATALDAWYAGERHPYDDAIAMPIHQARYWDYLGAIAAVALRRNGETLPAHSLAILADESAWRAAFAEQRTCFWEVSEEYEYGGGEDWFEAPYGIDLREAAGWATEGSGQLPSATTAPPPPVSIAHRWID